MRAVGKVLATISGVLASLVLVFIAAIAVLAYIDRCPQHASAESRLIADKIDRRVRAEGTFTVQDVTAKTPVFYCFAGPKSDMSDINAFASTRNYRLPSFEFYCGFWSWNGRLLLFYEDSVVDVPVSLSFMKNPDGAEAPCFSDPGMKITHFGV
jgi:hypothetical protein